LKLATGKSPEPAWSPIKAGVNGKNVSVSVYCDATSPFPFFLRVCRELERRLQNFDSSLLFRRLISDGPLEAIRFRAGRRNTAEDEGWRAVPGKWRKAGKQKLEMADGKSATHITNEPGRRPALRSGEIGNWKLEIAGCGWQMADGRD
jgi:hypothetical protein